MYDGVLVVEALQEAYNLIGVIRVGRMSTQEGVHVDIQHISRVIRSKRESSLIKHAVYMVR